MTKRKLRHKLHNLLKANGYELKEYIVQTGEFDFIEELAWIHKDTNNIISFNNGIIDLSFLIKYKIDKHISHGFGFSTHHQAWFGWSHRAIASFKIGSEVKKGDCAYQPLSKEDFIEDIKRFWSIDDGIWEECETPDITCTTILLSERECISEDHDNILGYELKCKTVFKGADRDYESTYFTPYPDAWGKGEWTAKTLEDARQMAIDFRDDVS